MMSSLTRPWVAWGLALLLGAGVALAKDKKDKPAKGKKGADASLTVTFTTDQRGAAQGWYAETNETCARRSS